MDLAGGKVFLSAADKFCRYEAKWSQGYRNDPETPEDVLCATRHGGRRPGVCADVSSLY